MIPLKIAKRNDSSRLETVSKELDKLKQQHEVARLRNAKLQSDFSLMAEQKESLDNYCQTVVRSVVKSKNTEKDELKYFDVGYFISLLMPCLVQLLLVYDTDGSENADALIFECGTSILLLKEMFLDF